MFGTTGTTKDPFDNHFVFGSLSVEIWGNGREGWRKVIGERERGRKKIKSIHENKILNVKTTQYSFWFLILFVSTSLPPSLIHQSSSLISLLYFPSISNITSEIKKLIEMVMKLWTCVANFSSQPFSSWFSYSLLYYVSKRLP